MKPRLLDLFSCGGGASVGYAQAGFDVDGCDIVPQKRYPYRLYVMDWRECLDTYGHLYAAFAASPPCQSYSALKHLATKEHAMLIEPVREALQATGKPYVIENVVGAPLIEPLRLCGSMFGLQTSCGAQLRRHRLFESNVLLMSPGPCQHGPTTLCVVGHAYRNEAERMRQRQEVISVCGDTPHNPRTWRAAQRGMKVISVAAGHARDKAHEWEKARTVTVTGSTPQQNTVRNVERETFSIEEARRAMGIDWLTMRELSQAIPPTYTEFIGRQLIEHCRG